MKRNEPKALNGDSERLLTERFEEMDSFVCKYENIDKQIIIINVIMTKKKLMHLVIVVKKDETKINQ